MSFRMMFSAMPLPKKTMLDRLRQAGLHTDRVTLICAVSPEDKPDLYARIDIGLAPFPMIDIARYFDMLWHGIPFVTMAGETPASRAGLCLLSDIGLDALAAEMQKGYVEKAVLLTQDINALTHHSGWHARPDEKQQGHERCSHRART